jgi:hypothetical protein
MKQYLNLAHKICNGEVEANCINNYQEIYNIAYNYAYKHIAQKQLKYFNKLQCSDIRKPGFIPEHLYNATKILINNEIELNKIIKGLKNLQQNTINSILS